jgi:hypothetical protein
MNRVGPQRHKKNKKRILYVVCAEHQVSVIVTIFAQAC